MALYRNISLSFWTDSKVDDEFTPEDKYFYLYLLTNPHTNICGCYEIGMKQMCRETGYNEDTVLRLIRRMEQVHDVIRYSPQTKEILIPHWGRYNWVNPKVRNGAATVAENIKNEQFKEYIKSLLDDRVSIPYGYGIQTSDTDTDYYTDTDTVPKKKRFSAPTVEEVSAYCTERGNNINPQQFVDFYEAKGWKVGNQSMKDWKACVRTWEQREAPSKKKYTTAAEYNPMTSSQEAKMRKFIEATKSGVSHGV